MRYVIMAAFLAGPALAEAPVLDLPGYEHFGILAVGQGPQYFGADEDVWAPVPAGRLSLGGNRNVTLTANYLSVNVIDHPNWRAGPAGILRFGRGAVQDDRVAELPDIDWSIDLGAFAGYEIQGNDVRSRFAAGVGVLQDVTGVHDGYVATAWARGWLPVGRYAMLGMGAAASWGSEDYMDTYFSVDAHGAAGSGLPIFESGAGPRDVRVFAVFVQPVSPEWAVGAGFLYGWMLDEAGDSPVVDDRGQLYAGVGVARAW